MRPVFWKDSFRNIKKRFVSWLSIMTIVFIGVGGILGINAASFAKRVFITDYYEEHNFKDFDLTSNLGIKKDEVDKIRQIDGVLDAEGVIRVSGIVGSNGLYADTAIISATDRVSVPYIEAGQMPKEAGECALGRELADHLSLGVGDSVSIKISSSRFSDILEEEKYTVSAICEHPDYILTGNNYFCVLPNASFDMSSVSVDYTNIFVDARSEADNILSDKYVKELLPVKNALEDLTISLADDRQTSYKQELDEEYEKKEKEVYDELGDAEDELKDAEKEVNEKIEEARQELEDAQKEFDEAREKADKEIKDGAQKIRDGEEEYNNKIADGERELKDAEDKLEKELEDARFHLFDALLQIDEKEKELQQKEKEYSEGKDAYEKAVEELEQAKAELDINWEDYYGNLSQLDSGISSGVVKEAAGSISVIGGEKGGDIAGGLYDCADADAYSRVSGVIGVYHEYHGEISENPMLKMVFEDTLNVEKLSETLSNLRMQKSMLEDGQARYEAGKQEQEDAKEQLEEARKLLDSGWFSLEEAKREYGDKSAELDKKEPEERQKLADAKADFEKQKEDGKKELEDARKTYNSEKAKAEKEIADAEKELKEGYETFESEKADAEDELKKAREEYEDARKDALDALEDARKEIDELKELGCKWAVQSRSANPDYLQYQSVYGVLANLSLYFTPLYVFVTAMVVFFTIAIIIEEQKTQIGTAKAFGMYKSEIRPKYLLFGSTSSITGFIFGIGLAFAIETVFNVAQAQSYIFGAVPNMFDPIPAVIMAVGSVVLVMLVVRLSCERLLSASAIGLIGGNEPKRREITKAKKGKSGVYTSLVINNIRTDIGRVSLSVVIIMACTMMISLGFTARYAFNTAIDMQTERVLFYDIEVTLSDKAEDEEKKAFYDLLEGNEYTSVYKTGAIIESDDRQTMAGVVCIEDQKVFNEFFATKDDKGRQVDVPEDGVLVTIEMSEKDKLSNNSALRLITSDLNISDLVVKGNYLKYFDKTIITTRKYYEENVAEIDSDNTYLVRARTTTKEELQKKFQSLDIVQSVSRTDTLREDYKDILGLYDAIIVVLLALSILLMFMVLLNLSNILVLHRMKELLTMRVNGFGNGQVLGYLARETIVTTGMGLLLGIVFGVMFVGYMVKQLEAAGVFFYREPYVLGWILSVAISSLFALIINSIAFKKIWDVPLTDITKY